MHAASNCRIFMSIKYIMTFVLMCKCYSVCCIWNNNGSQMTFYGFFYHNLSSAYCMSPHFPFTVFILVDRHIGHGNSFPSLFLISLYFFPPEENMINDSKSSPAFTETHSRANSRWYPTPCSGQKT